MRSNHALKIALVLAVQALCLLSASAKEPTHVTPHGNQVMIVYRLVLKNDIKREFYARSFGVSQDAPHRYSLPMVACEGCKSVDKNEEFADVGDFIFKTYTIPSDRVFKIDGSMLFLLDSQYLMMGVPLRLSCPIPKQVDYLYIGTYEIDIANDDFSIKSIKVRDEYDLAKEGLQRLVGNKATLYRGNVSQDYEKRYGSQFRIFLASNSQFIFTLD